MTDKAVKVSVLCITYNQAKYIRQTLDSFLMQKTDFAFEVLINDDASNDGTAEIIKEYQKKYPKIIKPVFHEKNLYSQGVRGMYVRFLLPKAQGKYIALCEGDDYWIDPAKLQRQVDFLEKRPDYALCFHPVRVFFENGEEKDSIFPQVSNTSRFTTNELLKGNFIQTNSVMYRKQSYENMATDVMPGDWYLHLYHAQFGKIGFLDRVMAVYRRHDKGIWWSGRKNADDAWMKHGVAYMALFTELLKIYDSKNGYRDSITSQVIDMFNRLMSLDEKYKTSLVEEALSKFPTSAELFLLAQNTSLQQNAKTIDEKDRLIQRSLVNLSRSGEEVTELKNSKSFITGYLLLHPWKAPREIAIKSLRLIKGLRDSLKNEENLLFTKKQYAKIDATITSRMDLGHKETAVILHLYYADLWSYFNKKLQSLDRPTYDLFISLPVGQSEVVEKIYKDYPDACIVFVPNRGRDVLPFLKIAAVLSRGHYKYVLKLHSKKSKHRRDGNSWLKSIVDNLIPYDPSLMASVFTTLNKEKVGIIGPKGQYVSLPVNYEANKYRLRSLVTELRSQRECDKVDVDRFEYGFFAGTMFWARLDAIRDIINKNFEVRSFELEKGQIDNTFAHSIERAFSIIPEIDGKEMYEISKNSIKQINYSTNNVPEWSDVYPKSEK